MTTKKLVSHIENSPLLSVILDRWAQIGLPDCWLVAGCLAQTVWNAQFGYAVDHGISDIDIIYFDPNDMSEDGEQAQAERIRALFHDVPTKIDVKNEARVHMWYEAKFGNAIAPYTSSKDAIRTFPTTATCVGICPKGATLNVFAPRGTSDLMNGVVKANKVIISEAVYRDKVAKWRGYWPELSIVEW